MHKLQRALQVRAEWGQAEAGIPPSVLHTAEHTESSHLSAEVTLSMHFKMRIYVQNYSRFKLLKWSELAKEMFQRHGEVKQNIYSIVFLFYRYLLELPPGPSVLYPLPLRGPPSHEAAASFLLILPSLPVPSAAWTPQQPGTGLPSTLGNRKALPTSISCPSRWVFSGKESLGRRKLV